VVVSWFKTKKKEKDNKHPMMLYQGVISQSFIYIVLLYPYMNKEIIFIWRLLWW